MTFGIMLVMSVAGAAVVHSASSGSGHSVSGHSVYSQSNGQSVLQSQGVGGGN